MIYWDNAATTWPKPAAVPLAVGQALVRYGANPGRAGHKMSMETAERVFLCRQQIADFFGLTDPEGVIFTANCTMSLNMVISGILKDGGHAITTDLEHNAVVRPLVAMAKEGARFDVVSWSADEDEVVENARRAIRSDTKLLVCTHASNVFGVVNPIRKLGHLAKEYGLRFCVDAAQTAGVLPINMERDNIDYLCVAPHKGLYGLMGSGLLLCREKRDIPPFIRGGTGSYSVLTTQPEELPDRLESGTINTPGICGLMAGLSFVKNKGRERIYSHEISLLQSIYEAFAGCERIKLYTAFPGQGKCVPVLSVNVENMASEEVAQLLDGYGVAVRAGLHCAPFAHRRYGTLETGTVRLAPSAFSTKAEAEKIRKLFLQIAEKRLH